MVEIFLHQVLRVPEHGPVNDQPQQFSKFLYVAHTALLDIARPFCAHNIMWFMLTLHTTMTWLSRASWEAGKPIVYGSTFYNTNTLYPYYVPLRKLSRSYGWWLKDCYNPNKTEIAFGSRERDEETRIVLRLVLAPKNTAIVSVTKSSVNKTWSA